MIMPTVEDIRTALAPVFEEYGTKSAVLFGSFAKGEASEYSDVDLLVDSGLYGLEFCGLLESLRMALDDRPVDVIDVCEIHRGSRIDREIAATGVKIFAQE